MRFFGGPMNRVCAAILVVSLSGCATNEPTISVQAINGKMYFVGENCVKYDVLDADSIRCTNRSGDSSYVANGLTYDQAQPIINQMAAAEAAKRVRRAQEIQQLTQSMQELGQSAQGWQQYWSQQSQQYTAPQISTYGNSSGVTYTRVGDAVIGSNGVTYRKVGNSIIGSDGTTCQIVGQQLICR
jgi:hypothetical protein